MSCTHPERESIDRDLVSGMAAAAVGRGYGISEAAMSRHKKTHLPQRRLAAGLAQRDAEAAAEETKRANSLSEWTAKLRAKAETLMLQAEQKGDLRTALAGCREALRACDVMARMSGAIPAAQVNVSVTHNHFQTLQVAILSALAPFPARKAVLLAGLKRSSTRSPGSEMARAAEPGPLRTAWEGLRARWLSCGPNSPELGAPSRIAGLAHHVAAACRAAAARAWSADAVAPPVGAVCSHCATRAKASTACKRLMTVLASGRW